MPVMEIRKQKPKRTQPSSSTPEEPVRREQVEAVRRRATRLNDEFENHTHAGMGDALVRQRQREIQQQLAQLRSEAVQARRLAEQISNLSRTATGYKRQPAMNDTSTINQGKTQGANRRVSDKSRSTGSQSKFNPLHPSMELPPEQLIRLLGLEEKMSRKKQKTAPAEEVKPVIQTAAAEAAAPAARPTRRSTTEKSLPKLEVPTDHHMYRKRRHTRRDTSPFLRQRTNLLSRAIGFGTVAGIAVSAYLFWWQPAAEHHRSAPVAKTTATPDGTPKPKTLPQAVAPITAKTQSPAPPTPAAAAPILPPAKASVKRESAPVDDPRWQAVVEAQEQRLRDAAEQRLRERIQTGSLPATGGTTIAPPPEDVVPASVQPVTAGPAANVEDARYPDALSAEEISAPAGQPLSPPVVPADPVMEAIIRPMPDDATTPAAPAAETTDASRSTAYEVSDSTGDTAATAESPVSPVDHPVTPTPVTATPSDGSTTETATDTPAETTDPIAEPTQGEVF